VKENCHTLIILNINNNFGFILKLETYKFDANGIRESAKYLVKIYHEDLN